MTPRDDLDRLLSAWVDDPFTPPAPRYLAQVLDVTRHTRQRRAWTSLERWLPMAITLRRPMLAPPLRWLAVGVALLLAVLAAMAVGGMLLTPTPGPTLPAVEATSWKNGLVAFGKDGDIWVAEPTIDGEARVLIAGPETDDSPGWSPDGTRIAFIRMGGKLMVANADGTDVREVTSGMIDPTVYTWSPDGTHLLVSSSIQGMPTTWVVPAAGGELRTVDAGFPTDWSYWKPDGTGFIMRGAKDGLSGLYPVSWPDLVVGDPIIQSDRNDPFYAIDRGRSDFQGAVYSSDGSQLALTSGMDNGDGKAGVFGGVDSRNYVLDADGSNLRMVEFDPASDYEDGVWFSPDGKRLSMVIRKGGDHRIAIMTLDGSKPPVASPAQADGNAMPAIWSPDGTRILAIRVGDGVSYLIDPDTGEQTQLPWLGSWADWQRIPG